MPKHVSYDDLVSVARKLTGQKLTTIGGRATFTVSVVDGEVYCTPSSTGVTRKLGRETQDALTSYNETGSLHPKDYQELTRNSSYILSLISRA